MRHDVKCLHKNTDTDTHTAFNQNTNKGPSKHSHPCQTTETESAALHSPKLTNDMLGKPSF